MFRAALFVTAALMSTAAVSAADLIIPTSPEPIYEAGGFSWEGLYVGARAGGQWFTAASYVDIGGVVGFNYMATDNILLGAEVTGDYLFTSNFNRGAEFFLNARGGVVVSDSVLLYALGGAGFFTRNGNTIGLYQLGGGAEYAVTDAVSVRGEVVGAGSFGPGNTGFIEAVKTTVGVAYHF